MSHIFIIHPDMALGAALRQTLQNVWKEPEYHVLTPENMPDTIPEYAIILGNEKPSAIPEQQFIPLPQAQPIRLQSLLQQIATSLNAQHTPAILAIADARLDTRSREWTNHDIIIDLTEKEVDTLQYLWRATAPVTREDLLRDVWAYAADADTHTIETHIYRLRQKIEKDPGNPEYLLTNKQGYYLAIRSNV